MILGSEGAVREVVFMPGKLVTINKYIKSNKGASMVELALVIPLLLLIFGGIIDFGYMMHQYLVVDELARSAARYSTVNKTDAEAEKLALNGRTDTEDWKIKFVFVKKEIPNTDAGGAKRSNVAVTVSCNRVELNGLLLSGLGKVVLPPQITRTVSGMTE